MTRRPPGSGRPGRASTRRRALLLLGAAVGYIAGLLPPERAGAIVGGEEAAPGAWPWQVALVFEGDPYCGGVLIAPDVVLTAAHCFEDVDLADTPVEARAGVVDVDDEAGQRRDVSEYVAHEGYDDDTAENDIAILRLAEPFELGPDVAPALLPDAATEAALSEEGDTAVVTGFGATEADGDVSRILRQATVAVYGDQHCTDNYAEDDEPIFGESQVCAGVDGGGTDSCYGDSGGPLVAPSPEGGAWYLIGLVSWGAGCGIPQRPTVHTSVTAFRDWLAGHGVTTLLSSRFQSDRALRLPALGSEGKASRYPATIEVAGFEGDLTSVAVELRGLTHGRLSDLDIWLVAPDGTVVTLLSDVAGDHAVEDLTLLVTAQAAAVGADVPTIGRAGPTDNEADPQRRGEVPAADLARLVGTRADGEWALLLADDARGASGTLRGWALVLQ